MSLNPQKMFNDKFGSTEQQNEQHFNQVFPKTNTNNFVQVTETISNNFDTTVFQINQIFLQILLIECITHF